MLATAMLLEAEPPRIVRGMGEYFFWRTPWLGELATQMGTVVGTPENCTALLEADQGLIVLPEGARGANKPFRKRYQLQPFGHGFMRLALATDAPIVPVGIIGPEEQPRGIAARVLRAEGAAAAARADVGCEARVAADRRLRDDDRPDPPRRR